MVRGALRIDGMRPTLNIRLKYPYYNVTRAETVNEVMRIHGISDEYTNT